MKKKRICWICRKNEANSGEHMIKKTEAGNFPARGISTKKGFHKIQGPNSKLIKFPNSICSDCNNNRTSPYDRAWEKLSDYLRNEIKEIREQNMIDTCVVFGNETSKEMMNVYLYFIKHFGCCIINDHTLPFNTETLSDSILDEIVHPNVYLKFNYIKNSDPIRTIGGRYYVDGKTQETLYIIRFYRVGKLLIKVLYFNDDKINTNFIVFDNPRINFKFDEVIGSWQPKNENILPIGMLNWVN